MSLASSTDSVFIFYFLFFVFWGAVFRLVVFIMGISLFLFTGVQFRVWST